MKAIGGFGGVKINGVVDGEAVSLEFVLDEARCSQPEQEPVYKTAMLQNGDTVMVLDGYRYKWAAFFEDTTKTKLDILESMIRHSQQFGLALTLYPQWNLAVPDSESYSVMVVNSEWDRSNLSNKTDIGHKIEGLEFVSEELIDELHSYTEGRYIPVYSTMTGEVILFGDIGIEILRSWRP